MKTRHLQTIQHGHWTTVIEYIYEGSCPYRVTTASELMHTQPQAFTRTLESAKKVAAAHMDEVKGLGPAEEAGR